ncbi:MAG TPA: sigma-70 family RNA polymerase sigma factor [Leeuwenhoekiella sp.]|nr:sigma-70 family RNA polymerase sigma factor [Leeuwenhoekiella sp.]
MDKEKEIALFEKLQQGDEPAFKKVYEDNHEKFIHFARKYGLEQAEAVDVYQDTYIAFYQNIMTGKLTELTSALGTYLFGIGKFLILKYLKKKKKKVHADHILETVSEEPVSLDKLDLNNENLTEEQQLLKNHFKMLGEQCQKLLILFYYRGFSIKEIIASEGYRNENVVKSQKSRCLKTLKERIHKPQ